MTQVTDSVTPPVPVRVGPHGRVVIPSRMRHALGLNVGAQLLARVEDGRLIFESREAEVGRFLGAWRALLDPGQDAQAALRAARDAEAALEVAEAEGDAAAIAAARDPIRRTQGG